MEPFTDTNSLPLPIAQVESTLHMEPGPASAPGKRAAAEMPVVPEQLLAAVLTSAGEVETAEWALDQAKAARDVQLAAALSAGVPAETVAAAAGVSAAALAKFIRRGKPAAAEA